MVTYDLRINEYQRGIFTRALTTFCEADKYADRMPLEMMLEALALRDLLKNDPALAPLKPGELNILTNE